MDILEQSRRYALAAWRHRWKALAVSWLVCLLGWAGVHLVPSQYQASARIYADADAVLGAALRNIAIDSSPAGQVELLQRTLLSRPNLSRLITRTDLDMRVSDEASREDLLKTLSKKIQITPQTRNLFTIEYRDTDPRLARDVVQAVVNLFFEAAASTDRQQMENARAFVGQQIASYEIQLRDAERRRAEFRTRYIDLLPLDTLGGASRAEAAKARLQQLQGELQDAQMRQSFIKRLLDSTPATLRADAAGGPGGESRLAEAERSLTELRLRYTDQHPQVIAARNVVEELRASGGAAARAPATTAPRSTGPRTNPLYDQLKMRMVDGEAQIASLQRQIQTEQAEVQRLEEMARSQPQLQAQFQNLDRDYNALSKQYEELLARREALQIAGAARTSADRVKMDLIDPPTVPSLPASPNYQLLSAGVFAAGLGAGVGLTILLVLLDTSFHTVPDLRQIGLPVLGAVSSARLPRRMGPAFAFGIGLLLLFGVFGSVLMESTLLATEIPALVRRMVA